MSREMKEMADEMARMKAISQSTEDRRHDVELSETTALIMMTIAMGQAMYMIHDGILDTLTSTRVSRNMQGRAKAALNQALKSMKTAKGCLADFDTMQEEFTSSPLIESEEQLDVAKAMLTNYHEIAELCSLYANAYRANPNVMKILRPILLSQCRYKTNYIRPETINSYRQL